MKINKTAIALMVSLSFPVLADSGFSKYNLRVPVNDKLSNWSDTANQYTDWISVGDKFDCLAWEPASSSVDYGAQFLQNRDCSINQERERIEMEKDSFSDKEVETGRFKEYQVATESESQTGTGSKTVRNMCIDILNRGQSSGDKAYTVDPDGEGPLPAKSAYCLMSQGGWTLYDSFGEFTGETGTSSEAYNSKGINSKSAINSAGYSAYLTITNDTEYHVSGQYMQFFYGGSPHGYIRKNLPSWVKGVRTDVSNQWRGSPDYVIFNSTVKTLSGYQGHTKFTFNGTGSLEFKETSIIWLDAVWVK